MGKKYLDKNVYEATVERIDYIFKEFDNVYVAFSGGKDSSILLNLCIDYIKTNNLNRKVGVMHLDYEAQYEYTTKHVDEMYKNNADLLNVYHACVPFKARTNASMFQEYWRPWDESDKDIWVRKMPKYALTKKDFDFYNEKMWDYEFQEKMSEWIHDKEKAKKTAVLVGIRTQESLNRYRAIKQNRDTYYKGKAYSKKMYDNIYNFYPIYDWETEDIWIANYRKNFAYNEIYDLYYKAGLPINKMRVASPFISEGQDTLKLYKAIEPETWGKMISRVNGVNFAGMYGGTSAAGFRKIKKPEHFTWEEYMYFLLDTLPEETKQNYLEKLNVSKTFWKERGGVLTEETIRELDDRNIDYEIGTHNYKTKKRAVKLDYLDDLDIKEFSAIPTYKRMCVCIMKNDHTCKYMGFGQNKTDAIKRKAAIEKYEKIL